MNKVIKTGIISKTSILDILKKEFLKNKYLYIMITPVFLYYLIFMYQPIYGSLIAFKHYYPGISVFSSPWAGTYYFEEFFKSYYFFRLLRNTLLISVYNIIFGFPAPIILALLLNEVRGRIFKRTVQTMTYLPHFISTVVVGSLILNFAARNGVINIILGYIGIGPIQFMIMPEWFRTIYVGSSIWQEIGWDSIIYLAALSSIDQQLYDACKIDGGGRLKQLMSVTIPSISPTIIIMLILRVGKIMNVGYEKIMLLYNSNTYVTADVISTFVYRKGILEGNFSYAAAVGLFNSVINLALLVAVNRISRKMSDTSLW
ncbi:MAG TPA: ABC transporter permease subunit [Ruminiclostridium sp.]